MLLLLLFLKKVPSEFPSAPEEGESMPSENLNYKL